MWEVHSRSLEGGVCKKFSNHSSNPTTAKETLEDKRRAIPRVANFAPISLEEKMNSKVSQWRVLFLLLLCSHGCSSRRFRKGLSPTLSSPGHAPLHFSGENLSCMLPVGVLIRMLIFRGERAGDVSLFCPILGLMDWMCEIVRFCN